MGLIHSSWLDSHSVSFPERLLKKISNSNRLIRDKTTDQANSKYFHFMVFTATFYITYIIGFGFIKLIEQ